MKNILKNLPSKEEIDKELESIRTEQEKVKTKIEKLKNNLDKLNFREQVLEKDLIIIKLAGDNIDALDMETEETDNQDTINPASN